MKNFLLHNRLPNCLNFFFLLISSCKCRKMIPPCVGLLNKVLITYLSRKSRTVYDYLWSPDRAVQIERAERAFIHRFPSARLKSKNMHMHVSN